MSQQEKVKQYVARVLSEHNACTIPDCPACARTVDTLAASSSLNQMREKR